MIDVSKIKFIAVETRWKRNCKGCAFEHEHSTVCHQVAEASKLRGILDCEQLSENGKGTIYKIAPSDDRQLSILPDDSMERLLPPGSA